MTLAIYLTRHLSCTHLNPAVSLSMALSGRMPYRKMPGYLCAQLIGAALAVLTLAACSFDQRMESRARNRSGQGGIGADGYDVRRILSEPGIDGGGFPPSRLGAEALGAEPAMKGPSGPVARAPATCGTRKGI